MEPRVVEDGDENRLTGYPALPTNLNPYLVQFGNAVLSAGAIRPLAGTYDIVFDSATAAEPGVHVQVLAQRHAAAFGELVQSAGPTRDSHRGRPRRRRLGHRPLDG